MDYIKFVAFLFSEIVSNASNTFVTALSSFLLQALLKSSQKNMDQNIRLMEVLNQTKVQRKMEDGKKTMSCMNVRNLPGCKQS
ncbi:hypothetical protein NQ317_004039 [Molorchus minor]|uniref:Uncharacterized protein n=1 Tax=Molorchus minor TaxID=1323400 RepID=A0ABQ9JUA5_9CUCU|nr:hypothetical protein NQ317_004039 [Molorchus minor]